MNSTGEQHRSLQFGGGQNLVSVCLCVHLHVRYISASDIEKLGTWPGRE